MSIRVPIIALILFVGIFGAMVYHFPWPFAGWWDYLYALFTAIVGIGLFGTLKVLKKVLTAND